MENTNTNPNQFDEDKVYSIVRNKTKNQKAVCSKLNGLEIAPGETVNLKAMFRKSQLLDATQEIFHFIQIGALEDLSEGNVAITPEAEGKSATVPTGSLPPDTIKQDLKAKIDELKTRQLLVEINGCTLMTRLEDILTDPTTPAEAKKAAKLRYMQLRGWVNDEGELIEGSSDDNNQNIMSIESWEFKPFDIGKVSQLNV